jgi:hypothetical protein
MKKTHYKKLKNPNYLGSWDLLNEKGEPISKQVKIISVKNELVFDGKGGNSECMVIDLEGLKPMIINSTNQKMIARLYGDFIEDWVSKEIVLEVSKVKAFGEYLDAVRVSSKPINKTKEKLNSERFEKALKAYNDKKITKEKLLNSYDLTKDQISKL